MHARTQACNRLAKAIRASHGPRAKAKEREKKNNGKSKGFKGAKGSCKGEASKTGFSGLENVKNQKRARKLRNQRKWDMFCTTDTSWIHDEWSPDEWNDGWSLDDWNDDWSSVGWHEDCEPTCDTSVSSFSLGSLDLGAKSSPKRFERVKMNLDTGAAVSTFPLNFSPGSNDNSESRCSTQR